MTQEALKLALEFIENSECGTADLEARIKQALAQTQEPVAWISPKGHIHFDPYLDSVPLYTTPLQRTWVGLTDDEYFALQMKIKTPMISVQDYIDAMRMAEAKLKEKNT